MTLHDFQGLNILKYHNCFIFGLSDDTSRSVQHLYKKTTNFKGLPFMSDYKSVLFLFFY